MPSFAHGQNSFLESTMQGCVLQPCNYLPCVKRALSDKLLLSPLPQHSVQSLQAMVFEQLGRGSGSFDLPRSLHDCTFGESLVALALVVPALLFMPPSIGSTVCYETSVTGCIGTKYQSMRCNAPMHAALLSSHNHQDAWQFQDLHHRNAHARRHEAQLQCDPGARPMAMTCNPIRWSCALQRLTLLL
eukprot:scaffold93196_cov19-Tisochrysis_lutea.AAC.1